MENQQMLLCNHHQLMKLFEDELKDIYWAEKS